MKKYLYLILTVVIALAMLTACGGEQTPESTEAGTAPTVPADPNAIASCVTGDKLVYVQTVEELIAAVDPSGNTVVTLLKDIENKKAIELPYSCTVDFAGFTVSTNPQQGLGVQVHAKGSENMVTTLKNGKLITYSDSIRVKEGAAVVENMEIHTAYGFSTVFYDVSVDKSLNRISGCTLLSSGGGVLQYGAPDADFSNTGITIENTTAVCSKEGGNIAINAASSSTVPGVTTLGENVRIYSYNDLACPNGFPFLGKLPVKEKKVTATIGDQSWENMTCWNTASEVETLDILMIGSSVCHSFLDEMYAMADAMDIAINVSNVYKAGCTLETHWGYVDDPSTAPGQCQYFVIGAMGRYEHPEITTTAEALQFQDWDIISCQMAFNTARIASVEKALSYCDPWAQYLMDYIRETCPDAALYWQQGWAYAVGYVHPNNEDDDPTNDRPERDIKSVADQTAMYEVVHEATFQIADQLDVALVPCAEAWQLARAQVGDTLHRSDYAHDGEGGGGQYLNAAVWLEVATGKSIIGNTWRPTGYILLEEKIPALQQAAHEAVAAIYGEDYAK